MLHHISFGVADIERSAAFYDAALAPLGYVRVWDDIRPGEADQAVGYGLPGGGDKLALKHRPKGQRPPGPGFHLAFAAPSQKAVAAFHAAALAQGGRDNGVPGLRPDYGPHYYAAFVIDLDGYHIEAVFNSAG
jgi:catechol 2,3-dioxygenase-like lactoylglutathione lyase family enzyme